MSKTRTKSWDAVEHLKSDEEMAAYLEAALEDGDPALVAAALGDIARAKGRRSRGKRDWGVKAFTRHCPPEGIRNSRPSSRLFERSACGCTPPPNTARDTIPP